MLQTKIISYRYYLSGLLSSWVLSFPHFLFMGSILVSYIYKVVRIPYSFADAINVVGKNNLTAGIFATYPAEYLTLGTGFLDQVYI